METTIREIPAPLMPENLFIEFYGYPEWTDKGIGAYEFWGQVGHHNQMVVVCEEVFWNEAEYSEAENTLIEAYLNANYPEIATELEDQFERTH